MSRVFTFIKPAVDSVTLPDIKFNQHAFMILRLEDGTRYFGHTNVPSSFIKSAFVGAASAYLKANRPVEVLYAANGLLEDANEVYQDTFEVHKGTSKTCCKTKGLIRLPKPETEQERIDRLVQERLITERKKIEEDVRQQIGATMVHRIPVEHLLTATAAARESGSGRSAKWLNNTAYELGYHEPYIINGATYWKLTEKGGQCKVIDSYPVRTGSITTTGFTVDAVEWFETELEF